MTVASMPGSLHADLAVVTGGASGIGRAIALTLGAAGARVAIADVDESGAGATARLIEEAGGEAAAFAVDIADRDAVARTTERIVADVGVPGILVNNAGWDETHPFVETDAAFWEKVVSINYLGPVAVTHGFLRPMIDAGAGGRIVNISSDAGRVGSLGETVYAGTKGGVIAFTKSLAREVARYAITVNCVCPGPTDTPLFHNQSEKIREALVRAIPFRRLAQPEEIAHAVQFFASRQAAYITGQVLSVSGGLTMAG